MTENNDSQQEFVATGPRKSAEIKEAREALQNRATELEAAVKVLANENHLYKRQYKTLMNMMASLNGNLERVVAILGQLFDNGNSTLQMTRLSMNALNCSPTSRAATNLGSSETMPKTPPPPPPSQTAIPGGRREKIPITRFNIKEIQSSLEEEDVISFEHIADDPPSANSSLTTIPEEVEDGSGAGSTLRELYVRLHRLPGELTTTLNNSNTNLSESSTRISDLQQFTSTPLQDKVSLMKQLGLMPTPTHSSESPKPSHVTRRRHLRVIVPKDMSPTKLGRYFVTARRKLDSSPKNTNMEDVLQLSRISPVREPKRYKSSPKEGKGKRVKSKSTESSVVSSGGSRSSRQKRDSAGASNNETVLEGRVQRKAKMVKEYKEPSLKRKLRR